MTDQPVRVGALRLHPNDRNYMYSSGVRTVWTYKGKWYARRGTDTPVSTPIGHAGSTLAGLLDCYKGATFVPLCKRRAVVAC
jgi:hypothetical protein